MAGTNFLVTERLVYECESLRAVHVKKCWIMLYFISGTAYIGTASVAANWRAESTPRPRGSRRVPRSLANAARGKRKSQLPCPPPQRGVQRKRLEGEHRRAPGSTLGRQSRRQERKSRRLLRSGGASDKRLLAAPHLHGP